MRNTASRVDPNFKKVSKKLLAVPALVMMSWGSAAFSAMVTLDIAGLNDIYGVTYGNFDPADAIEFRALPTQTVVDPTLLDISSSEDFNNVKNAIPNPNTVSNNTIHLYFIDTINWCGRDSPNAVGCAENNSEIPGVRPGGGNDLVVESVQAAKPGLGKILLAHEIGHNLNLDHLETGNNVMESNVGDPGNLNFTSTQVSTILDSFLIQDDNGQNFIEILPILVSATAVPLPGGLILLVSALAPFGVTRLKRRSAA